MFGIEDGNIHVSYIDYVYRKTMFGNREYHIFGKVW